MIENQIEKVLPKVFLIFLLSISHSQTYTFNNISITLSTVSSGPILFNSSSGNDQCGILIADSTHIFHASNANRSVVQISPKDNVASVTGFNRLSGHPLAMGPSEIDLKILASTNSTPNYYELSIDPSSSSLSQVSNSTESNSIVAIYQSQNKTTTLQIDNVFGQQSTITSNAGTYNLSNTYIWLAVNKIHTVAISWSTDNQITIINLNNMNLMRSTPVAYIQYCNQINFSHDSQLMILEFDHYKYILVYNITTLGLVHFVSINDTILQTHFLDPNSTLMAVIGQTAFVIVNLTTGQQYSMPPITAVSFDIDQLYNIFTCHQNTLSQQKIIISQIPISSVDQQNDQSQFYTPLEPNQLQWNIINYLQIGMVQLNNVTTTVKVFANVLPVSIYFMSFINYFTMSSLYVLLNYPLPEQLYSYLSSAYTKVNQNLLGLFGIKINIPPYAPEAVTSKRGLFFGVSSQIVSNNVASFIFMMMNLAFILGIQFLTSELRNCLLLKKLVKEYKWDMIHFQIVNLMLPLILPWTFIMIESGVRDYQSKLSKAGYLVIFFMGLVFPIYYFFDLLSEKQNKLIKQREFYNRLNATDINQQKPQICTQNQTDHKNKGFLKVQPNTKKPRTSKRQKQETGQKQLKDVVLYKKVRPDRNRLYKIQVIFPKNKSEPPKKSNFSKQKSTLSKDKVTTKKNQSTESLYKPKNHQYKPITLSQLVSGQIVQQWYMCQANFLLPSLVLLSNPLFFLIAIFFYSILGMVVALRKTSLRINSFILSCYPFLFHCCFLVFYWCKSSRYLIIFEIVCLFIFLVGSFHHSITLLYEILVFLKKLYKNTCKANQIKPQNQVLHKKVLKVLGDEIFTKQQEKQINVSVSKRRKKKVKMTKDENRSGSLNISRNSKMSSQC